MKNLRMTIDDVNEGLRQQGVFDIRDAAFAVVETGGKLSVKKKYEKSEVTAEMLDLKPKPDVMPIAVAGDGRISKAGLEICGMSEESSKAAEGQKNRAVAGLCAHHRRKKRRLSYQKGG